MTCLVNCTYNEVYMFIQMYYIMFVLCDMFIYTSSKMQSDHIPLSFCNLAEYVLDTVFQDSMYLSMHIPRHFCKKTKMNKLVNLLTKHPMEGTRNMA